jgi:hypothetical protein
MAATKWNVRQVKAGVRVQGAVTLACSHKITEYAVARTEEGGKALVSRLLVSRTTAHAKDCSG